MLMATGRVGVEVVARTRLRLEFRYRVARAPNGEPCVRIVGAGLPDAAPASFPRVILIPPRLAPRIAGFGYHIPPPELITSSRIQRRDPSSCPGIPRPV